MKRYIKVENVKFCLLVIERRFFSRGIRERKKYSKKSCHHYWLMLIGIWLSQFELLVQCLVFSSMIRVLTTSSSGWRESGVGGEDMLLDFLSLVYFHLWTVFAPPHSLSELATSLLFCMTSNPTHPHVPVIYWCHLGLILLLHCLIWMHLNILNLFSNVCKWYAHSLFSLGFKIFVSISVHDMGLACLGLCCFDFIRPLPFWFMCAAGSCSVFG